MKAGLLASAPGMDPAAADRAGPGLTPGEDGKKGPRTDWRDWRADGDGVGPAEGDFSGKPGPYAGMGAGMVRGAPLARGESERQPGVPGGEGEGNRPDRRYRPREEDLKAASAGPLGSQPGDRAGGPGGPGGEEEGLGPWSPGMTAGGPGGDGSGSGLSPEDLGWSGPAVGLGPWMGGTGTHPGVHPVSGMRENVKPIMILVNGPSSLACSHIPPRAKRVWGKMLFSLFCMQRLVLAEFHGHVC